MQQSALTLLLCFPGGMAKCFQKMPLGKTCMPLHLLLGDSKEEMADPEGVCHTKKERKCEVGRIRSEGLKDDVGHSMQGKHELEKSRSYAV